MALGLFSIMLQIMNPTKLANRTENDLLYSTYFITKPSHDDGS
jgi:hypothetical protein